MAALDGQAALVTGADRGIGKGIAMELARLGCQVAVNYHGTPELADATVAGIEAAGGRAFAVQGDVSVAASVERMFRDVIERAGRLPCT